MKKTKVRIIILIFLAAITIFLINYHIKAVDSNENSQTYIYNNEEYTISYDDSTSSETGGPAFLEDGSLIFFTDMEATVTYKDYDYVLTCSNDEVYFSLDNLNGVKEYQEYKEEIRKIIDDEEMYSLFNSRSLARDSLDNAKYDVAHTFEENIGDLKYIHSIFLMNSFIEVQDSFSSLSSYDVDALIKIKNSYIELSSDTYEAENDIETFMSDMPYSSFDDMIDDYNYKIAFDEKRDEVTRDVYKLIRRHDNEEIYEILDSTVSSLWQTSYEQCFENRDEYFNSLVIIVIESAEEAKDAILLFQAKERFENYFNEYMDKYSLAEEESIEEVYSIIEDAKEKMRDLEEPSLVYALKDETLEKIKKVKVSSISTRNGDISASDGISADSTLTIKNVKNESFSQAAYEVSIDGEESSDNTYTINIYDVEYKYVDIEVYRVYNGEKVKLRSNYENNTLTVETDTLGTIYVVRKNEAPWGQMAIVFGSLFTVLIATLIIFNRGKKNEE